MNPALAVAAVAALAYLPSLWGVFHFDDYNVIVNYPTVHSWEALFERAGGGVRPLLKASYTFNWTLGVRFQSAQHRVARDERGAAVPDRRSPLQKP